MPATMSGASRNSFVLGVDGCRGGWLAVELCVETGAAAARLYPKFQDIYDRQTGRWRAVAIDMPIGLCDIGRRTCDSQARKLLGAKRAASVFAPPRRPMLAFDDYAAANAWGKAQGAESGGGLSKQAWMIRPKIMEIDALATPEDQQWLMEAHPEVAFLRLNEGKPCAHSKRTTEGARERSLILRRGGIRTPRLAKQLPTASGKTYGLDDLYDAAALALSAKERLFCNAIKLGDGARDARGLEMEIWG
ncbi:MAG: DUF429 domain-containing protein [Pseudomonadota bacterium]